MKIETSKQHDKITITFLLLSVVVIQSRYWHEISHCFRFSCNAHIFDVTLTISFVDTFPTLWTEVPSKYHHPKGVTFFIANH